VLNELCLFANYYIKVPLNPRTNYTAGVVQVVGAKIAPPTKKTEPKWSSTNYQESNRPS